MKLKGLMLAAVAVLALGGVASCGEVSSSGPRGDEDFAQNTGVEVTPVEMSIIGGNFGGWNQDAVKADASLHFQKVSDYKYVLEITDASKIGVGSEFKFTDGYTWGNQFGVEDMDFDTSTTGLIADKDDGTKGNHGYTEGKNNRSNFKLAKACKKLTVTYYPFTFMPDKCEDNVHGLCLKLVAELA